MGDAKHLDGMLDRRRIGTALSDGLITPCRRQKAVERALEAKGGGNHAAGWNLFWTLLRTFDSHVPSEDRCRPPGRKPRTAGTPHAYDPPPAPDTPPTEVLKLLLARPVGHRTIKTGVRHEQRHRFCERHSLELCTDLR